jgi:hypothetical protein
LRSADRGHDPAWIENLSECAAHAMRSRSIRARTNRPLQQNLVPVMALSTGSFESETTVCCQHCSGTPMVERASQRKTATADPARIQRKYYILPVPRSVPFLYR